MDELDFVKVKEIIYTAVCSKISETERCCSIRELLDGLNPDIPADGTTEFIAFNAGDKRLKLLTNRFLTRKLNLNHGFLSDEAIRELAANINKSLFPDKIGTGIRLDTGTAITENYRNSLGGKSCMTGNSCEYTRLYEMNPKRFKQLVMVDENDTARAIVHLLDNGQRLMDRVYATAEHLKARMKEYALAQGWLTWDIDNGWDTWIVSGLTYRDGCIPFMDTLTKGTIMDGLLTISYSSGDFVLNQTDGCLEENHKCSMCGHSTNNDDAWTDDDGNMYCRDCYDEGFFCCDACHEDCSQDGAVMITDTAQHVCSYCASNNYYLCNNCGDVFSTTTETDDHEYLCNGCLDSLGYRPCSECGEYTLDSNHCGQNDNEDEQEQSADTNQTNTGDNNVKS